MKKQIWCCMKLLSVGGALYGGIELLWRKYTHWSMILTGGICFTILFKIFARMTSCSLWIKCCIGSTVITYVEFISGFFLNYCLRWKVWDYSHCRFNFCGQICLIYSIFWGLLTVPVSALCRFLHRKLHWE